MSIELAVGILSEAWHKFGGFTVHNQVDVVSFCLRRQREILNGESKASVAHPTLPRTMERSWYEPEREPGSDDQ